MPHGTQQARAGWRALSTSWPHGAAALLAFSVPHISAPTTSGCRRGSGGGACGLKRTC